MIYKIIPILFLSLSAAFAQSQEIPYYLTAEAGAGYSHYITSLDIPDLNQSGFNGSFRIMWHPEHLLSLGLETGYSNLYSLKTSASAPDLGTSDVKVSMTSVPIMGVYSMKIFPYRLPEFELKVSTGILLLTNHAEGFGGNLTTSQICIGYSVAATYLTPISEFFSVGGELKYQYLSKLEDSDIALQLLISYSFLKY